MSDALTPLSAAQSAIAIEALQACRDPNAALAEMVAADPPVALNVDQLLNGLAADPRYARAAAVLPAIVAHFMLADADAPAFALKLRQQRAEEIRDWIEHAVPMVTA